QVLGLPESMCTRRWYYLIPMKGTPSKLVHRIEENKLDSLPGTKFVYSSWEEQHELLRKILSGKRRVAMQYSPMNDIPYVGLVDCGTVELVRSFGPEVLSSADLVQMFEARWSPEGLAAHRAAGKVVHKVIRQAFAAIKRSIEKKHPLTEYELQRHMAEWFVVDEIESSDPPIVAVNAHSGDPHYSPREEGSPSIGKGDFVLLDVWGKQKFSDAVYFDITWTGYVGDSVPDKYREIFDVVREARDRAVSFIQKGVRKGRTVYGWEVDDVARKIISEKGYGPYFLHRTGHSIGREVHGNGANMDNFETRDGRRIVPGTGFSIEPGIYLRDFGVRTEVNVHVSENDAEVTGELQQAVVPILAGD
ncbi:MAG: M24 family metallopeptidase, partial [Acidobacteriota bacterium]